MLCQLSYERICAFVVSYEGYGLRLYLARADNMISEVYSRLKQKSRLIFIQGIGTGRYTTGGSFSSSENKQITLR